MNPTASLLLALALATSSLLGQEGRTGPSNGQPLAAPAVYQVFGSGCAGSGGSHSGVILPAAFANTMAGGGNYFPFGRQNQRYQQVFRASEVSTVRVLTGLAVRQPSHSGAGGPQQIEALMGVTSFDETTLTSSFPGNGNVLAPQSLFKATLQLPALGANTDPSYFPLVVKFTRPWVYSPTQGNLLVEIVNTSTTDVIHGWDAASGATVTTTRLYGSPATTTTGTMSRNYGLVFCFLAPTSNATPVLAATGRPILNTTFSVDLSNALASTPALLLTGVSKTLWGTLPLPLDLTSLGAPGCQLLCSPDLVFGLVTDTAGRAKLPLSIPNDQRLNGLRWFNQYAVIDPVNALRLAFSNGGEAIVGDS
jgi:hypothetical protein